MTIFLTKQILCIDVIVYLLNVNAYTSVNTYTVYIYIYIYIYIYRVSQEEWTKLRDSVP